MKFLDRHFDEKLAVEETLDALRESGYSADELDLVALHTSLKTAPFTVLAGSSGTGKTSLLRGYTQAMGVNLTTIAVQPNWYSAADLHGYVNPLNDTFYETAFTQALERQTGFSDFDDSGFLDLVLLDEINLSRVEYFLADYLSALEHGEGVELIPAGIAKNESTPEWLRKKRGKIIVPKTLLITGTANEDHTTQTFSDRFRDRSAILGVSKSPKIALGASMKIIQPKKRLSHATWHNWRDCTGNITKLDKHKGKITTLLETPKLSVSKRSSEGVWQFFIHAHDLLYNLDCADAADKALDLALTARFLQKYVALWKVQEESKRESVDALKKAINESGYELTRSRAMLESLE